VSEEVRTFFRFCPSCGRRFHIQILSKEKVAVEREEREEREPGNGEGVVPGLADQVSGFSSPVPLFLEEGHPAVIDLDEIRYSYRCKHCGHEWTEEHIQEKEER
jgi:DNA-directed RNA polymerase subunit RPC12/RpoP